MTICDFAPHHYAASDYRRANPLPHRCGAMCRAVERFCEAVEDGLKWGNAEYAHDQQVLAKMSVAEKTALEAKKAADDAAAKKSVVAYKVDMRKKLYTTVDGLAKRKFNRMCKKERFDGGCFLHTEKHGSCSFVHKDERSRYETVFAGFGMKMVDDAAYFVELVKFDKATAAQKTRQEAIVDAMEMTLKKEARCIFITGVDATGNLTFVKSNPAHTSSSNMSSTSSGSGGSGSGAKKQQQQQQQQSNAWEKKVDNGAW